MNMHTQRTLSRERLEIRDNGLINFRAIKWRSAKYETCTAFALTIRYRA